jgi:NAD(P)-dependent dehydrogenase (short-subunit alcohol dehydrogenase family)
MLSDCNPLDRVADLEEIAGTVSYFASPETSFMTASSLTIDAGWTPIAQLHLSQTLKPAAISLKVHLFV